MQHLYHNKYLTTINFIEEALPFTDVIPTATIGELTGGRATSHVFLQMCGMGIWRQPYDVQCLSAGWFMEYTRGGKKVQKEGESLMCTGYSSKLLTGHLSVACHSAGQCSCMQQVLDVRTTGGVSCLCHAVEDKAK